MKKIIITTSWDDGALADLRLSSLLDKCGIKGTFYIPQNCDLKKLSDDEIKKLSQNHEIGGHTKNHVDLTSQTEAEMKDEIVGGKEYLENIIGQKIKMFSYPMGLYNQQVIKAVRQGGFIGARTVEQFKFNIGSDFYKLPATLHIYPFPLRKRNAKKYHLTPHLFDPLKENYKQIRQAGLSFNSMLNWRRLAKAVFDKSLQSGEYFHLFGHSWEIEKYGMWRDLDWFLKYISGREECEYLKNSEIIKLKN